MIQRTPVPDLNNSSGAYLGQLALACVDLKRNLDIDNELGHAFHLPALLQAEGEMLIERVSYWQEHAINSNAQLALHQREIDNIAFKLYGIDGENRRAIEESLNSSEESPSGSDESDEDNEGEAEKSADARALVINLVSYLVGAPFGRWDVRYATGEKSAPELPDPFAALPACPPGMLQDDQGLPATPGDVLASYLRISWPGILVDDEGHPEDVEGRVREALRMIWGERAEAIEQEACEILGIRALRDYFRKTVGFFADHLSRYSKSRRQAPIYWPLSTPSGSYTLWLYYHRLTDQTLYSCVNDFVEPKLAQVSEHAAALQRKSGRTAKEEKELEHLTDLERELREFRAELLRVAAFWKPNLNDGVQITAAPLWKLFQHKPWQKTLKDIWEKL